ncbi:hypothetical protein KIW84_024596 [Lathyrus oleraceus]|uniref:ATP-dependent DNA helicase n=1 Tax=Pisum sativum TaxID=3888 RepID=A0A9D4YG45_PEA|nr:hypothetical protein KIW84_024596 [Pisum sativum]
MSNKKIVISRDVIVDEFRQFDSRKSAISVQEIDLPQDEIDFMQENQHSGAAGTGSGDVEIDLPQGEIDFMQENLNSQLAEGTVQQPFVTETDLTNVNFASRFYQRAHDNKAGSSTTYASRVPSTDHNFTYPIFQQNDNHEARPFIKNIDDNDCGVHVDEILIATGRGIYTFRAQGTIYHKIGGFHLNQDSRPRYLQLYIYDTDNELQNKMRENPILNQAVVYKLQKLLHQCNLFVIVFRQHALEPNIEECRLLIKERSSNQPQYSLPSASQVAAIVIGDGDEDTIERGRDINVINCDGKLTKVQETMGYYDPLQYPILLPFGTYGWDIETKTNVGKNVTCREYYSYVLQIRRNDQSVLLKPGRLLQHKRDMTQRYQDGMAIVLNNGKPVIFLTMTCNPSWIEITSELGLHQTPQDRPDLLTRIFRSKCEQLKDDVINIGDLGRVKSYMYVTEFQKRGLPHVHMLLILDTDDKLREPEEYDSVVKAEIPQHESEPELNKSVDNRWVVPYNPWLLLKYDCHINVEICNSINSIKYLYKYVYKGPDRVAMEVHRGTCMDEIQQYVDARWICAPETLWKIFKFKLYKLYPSVERLQIHLPNHHQVRFYKHQRITDVLNDNQNAVTMLTEFFALNQMDPHAHNYLYREILEHYCWLKGVKNGSEDGQNEKLLVESTQYLLQKSDNSIRECMLEASNMRKSYALRRWFVTILIFCEPTDVRGLFNEFYPYMVDDYQMTNIVVGNNFEDMLLRELRDLLLLHGKVIKNDDLSILTMETNEVGGVPTIIQEELSVQIPNEDIQSVEKLNNDQMSAYNTIMNVIHQKQSQISFVDGPGGTCTTFLYRTIMENLRRNSQIILATASLGIAAT